MSHDVRATFKKESCISTCEAWGLDIATVSDLPSYDDLNFRLTAKDGKGYVLKVSADQNKDSGMVLDLENQAFLELQAKGFSQAPTLMPIIHGELQGKHTLTTVVDGVTNYVRIITFVEGVLYSKTASTAENMGALGRDVGRMSLILRALDSHPGCAIKAGYEWDNVNAMASKPLAEDVVLPSRKALALEVLDAFEREVLPVLSSLPKGTIHGDVNDYNIIMDKAGSSVAAIIDFGDIMNSLVVNEPAVCLAYCLQQSGDDFLAHAQAFLAGFTESVPLNDTEMGLLRTLIAARIVVSTCQSAHNQKLYPENIEYLQISEEPGWVFLEKFWPVPKEEVLAAFSK